jgi:hypothetical protein
MTQIISIDTVRETVRRHWHRTNHGTDYDQAIDAAAVELCLPPETVREAMQTKMETV